VIHPSIFGTNLSENAPCRKQAKAMRGLIFLNTNYLYLKNKVRFLLHQIKPAEI